MARGRRVQRSIRVTVAGGLVAFAAVFVASAVGSGLLVAPAALTGAAAGLAGMRIMYAEVVQTRGAAARSRAEQARDFRSTLERHQREHTRYARAMGARVAARDRTIASLGRTVRTLEHRVAEAESRVRREARRANEAQERLGALLDEVLGTAVLDLDEASLVPGSALVEAERTDVRHRSGTRGAGHAARATGARADDGSAADERAARPRPTVVELVGWEARGGTTAGARGDGGAVA